MNTFRTFLRQNIFLATAAAFIAAISIPLSTTHAAVNDFTISSYAINYTLGRNSDNHSTLTTKETIVADFPQSDQNHGIERAIPKEYDGHPTYLDVKSVTDQNGKSIEYSKLNNSGNYVLQIGDGDTYVHGKQTYVITYTQRDVTRYFSDTNADEFYWDTNGTNWKVPIRNLSVTLNVDKKLQSALNGNTACYQGEEGSNKKCTIAKNGDSFAASAQYLNYGENVTISLGFAPNTFAQYKATPFEMFSSIWQKVLIVSVLVSLVLAALIGIRYRRQSMRSSEQKPIAPEYTPSNDSSVAEVARLIPTGVSSFAPQLIDFAVRGYIKIYETEAKNFFGKTKKEYSIEIIKSISELRAEEQEFLGDVFSDKTEVGAKLELKDLKYNTKLSKRLQDNGKKLEKLERNEYGLYVKAGQAQQKWYTRLGIVFIILTVLLLSPAFASLAALTIYLGKKLWILTDRGLQLVRHNKGLKMYISVAETERLKMLQSPEGAEKTQIDPNDPKQLVKLYEKTLPYAMLFGKSKEWNKQLGKYYESTNSTPDWYYTTASISAFNALSFSDAINDFSSFASSSSGGSDGGGSSGGGGGGGGGGGW